MRTIINRIIAYGAAKGLFKCLPDKQYLKLVYWARIGKRLNLNNPQTFNEKIQWLKLYDRRHEYIRMVDKYEVKKYVADIIGEQYIIPTSGVWENFDSIDFESLPQQFVLKCTHDSGGVFICNDKSKFNIEDARKKINSSMKKNYYFHGREWPYKNVKPRIIAEQYIYDKKNIVPEDYKIYCFNGKPKYIVVFHNRFNDAKNLSETVYDIDWKPQNISLDNHFEVSDIIEPKPKCLEELLNITKMLCKNHAQVRIDFYIVNNIIYFGEITLSTASGFQPMIPEELDEFLGREIDISSLKSKENREIQ